MPIVPAVPGWSAFSPTTIRYEVHAVRPGTVTLATTTAPFAGDPQGPPQYRWQITVQVTA